MGYGSDPEGGFNEASKAYKNEPTVETYLALRRADPDAEIEVSVLAGLDAVFAFEDEFRRFGLEPQAILGLLDANPKAVSSMALRLLQNIVDGRDLEKRGETHVASRELIIPNKLVDWLICVALEGMSWNDDLTLDRDLIVLIRERLGGPRQHYKAALDVHEQKQTAIWFGAQLVARGEELSIRRIASIMNVAPSTVSRWFDDTDLRAESERLSVAFNSNGSLKSLAEAFPPVAPK